MYFSSPSVPRGTSKPQFDYTTSFKTDWNSNFGTISLASSSIMASGWLSTQNDLSNWNSRASGLSKDIRTKEETAKAGN